jgi:hypothetical protein
MRLSGVSSLVVGVVVVTVGVLMLRFRDRIAGFWQAIIPWPGGNGPPRWYRVYAYIGGPLFLILCGIALVVSGVVDIAN